ncbi:Nramp family divalent metal transporter [Shouchella clausii]|uniref:Nramp family divalent metal transporter n=1 Tax=Shouchella clausii TaxID=79880 RepID=UPI0031FC2309
METKEPLVQESLSHGQKEKLTFAEYMKSLGPGTIVAAGIIGPGTVTTASVAGATYGYQTVWILILACIIAYFYQEPALRIAVYQNMTIMEGVRRHISPWGAVFLFVTILVGVIAFQAGNFIGAGLAMSFFAPGVSTGVWACILAVLALIISWVGVYRLMENIMTAAVVLMALAFVITAFSSGPDLGQLVTEGFSLTIPGGDIWLVAALVATTLPPNIVLALSVFTKKRNSGKAKLDGSHEKKLKLARFDLGINSVILAVITVGIVIAAGTVIFPTGQVIASAADMAVQLTPLLGRYAGILFALGLFAAGFTSGLYQISLQPSFLNDAFGWEDDAGAVRSKLIMILAALSPIVIIFLFGSAPIQLVITAQALNGVALPIVAIFVLILLNKKAFLGDKVNNRKQNIIFGAITCIVVILGLQVLLRLIGVI